jgi:hypothetical protein
MGTLAGRQSTTTPFITLHHNMYARKKSMLQVSLLALCCLALSHGFSVHPSGIQRSYTSRSPLQMAHASAAQEKTNQKRAPAVEDPR